MVAAGQDGLTGRTRTLRGRCERLASVHGRRPWVVLAVAALALTPAARAATITVGTNADDLTVNGNCTLREAIHSANTDTAVDGCAAGSAADTIVIPAGTYAIGIAGGGEQANATGDFDLASDITLQGAGRSATTLDGAHKDRVVEITSGTVTIAHLTITGGGTADGGPPPAQGVVGLRAQGGIAKVSEDGGGIYNSGTLTLQDVAVTANATGAGGAGGDATGTVGASNADGQEADGAQGGTSGSGGGIFSFGPLVVIDSTITQNSTGHGGAGGAATGGVGGPGTAGNAGGSGGPAT